MRKTTEAQDYAAEVAERPVGERLLVIGCLACSEAQARAQAQDAELVAERAADQPGPVRAALIPPMRSARRARDRILEHLQAVAHTA